MSGAEPQLSVIVATHNRRDLLARCLEALSRQTLDPGSFEVIVADDGSSDGAPELVEGLETRFQLRLLRLDKGGQAAAQNAAIEIAAGRTCLFLDDDCIPAPGCLEGHVAAHRAGAGTIGIGALLQQPPQANDWYAHTFAKAWNEHYERLADRQPEWTDCYGGNLSAPRRALQELGGFSTDLAIEEDADLAFRLAAAGCVPAYLPDAEAVHDDQKRRGRLIEDARRQGAGHVALAARYPAALPKLLGWFGAPTARDVALRRLLLALRVSPAALALPGRLLPRQGSRLIWFYFVSRYAFWLGVRGSVDRELWLRMTRRVPVLMYHAFSEADEGDRYVLPRRAFRRQMRLLALLRYRVIDFEELARSLRDGPPPPRRALVITIDDGYRDNLEIAQPILRRRRFPATIFLVSDRLGGVNDWDREGVVCGRPLLTVEEIEELREGGISFGAHTRTHVNLEEAGDEAIEAEVAGSRRDLEGVLGSPVRSFAYPYGRRDARGVAAVGRAGYEAACTTHPERARLDDDRLQIPRIEIRAEYSLAKFLVRVLRGGR